MKFFSYSVLLFSIIFLGACDPFHSDFGDVEQARLYVADSVIETPAVSVLKIMTWNIKFGGGRIDFFFDCYGDRVLMNKSEVIDNMAALTEKIKQYDPDILLLQEVDVNSKRSAYTDELKYILNHTSLNYGAYASQWKADFVPSDGIGRVDSGNAVLSKWGIVEAQRIALPLISEQDALTQYFYLKRNILKIKINMHGREFYVLNIHTSAYSHDGTKKKQLDKLKEMLDKLNSEGTLFFAGGDFNTIPPGSVKTSNFPDSVCVDEEFQADDYTDETDWLDAFYADYTPAVSLNEYSADNSKWFSHTTDKNGFWNRKLDYLFTNGSFIPDSAMVHQNTARGGMETMPLSDHAPLTVEAEVTQ